MKLPQEIDVWYVIPAIRRELAKRLVGQRIAQKDVAKILDVTAAAISQYLREKRAKGLVFPDDIASEIDQSASRIMKDNTRVMKEIIRLCRIVRDKGICCTLHKEISADVPDNCAICKE